MNTNDQIPEAEVVPPTTAVATRDPNTPPPEKMTPAQARVEAVGDALKAAYANASQLKLTQEESTGLAEDFPDEAFRLGAGGDPGLIYIEHAYLRMRLNKVLGVGAAVPIRRREWAEEFQYYKDGAWKTGIRVYADVVLVVRGCVVGEAIGDSVYYPENAKTNYSDALESAKSNAFRRCCKEFGVGLQAWLKGWVEGWKQRQNARQPSGGSQGTTPPPKTQPAPQRETRPAAKASDIAPATQPPPEADKDQRFRFLASLSTVRTDATKYFVLKGWITEGQQLEDLPNKYVPSMKRVHDSFVAEFQAWMDGGKQAAPEWRTFLMPWGREKDTPLAELDKKYLFGLFMNYEVELTYNGAPKPTNIIEADQKFRAMLDEAGSHYEWKREAK